MEYIIRKNKYLENKIITKNKTEYQTLNLVLCNKEKQQTDTLPDKFNINEIIIVHGIK